MATKDKLLLLNKIDETLKPRMFANMLEEAQNEIQDHLNDFDVTYNGSCNVEHEDFLESYINAKRVEGLQESTLSLYRFQIEKMILFSKVSTSNITTDHVRNYLASESEKGVQDCTLENTRIIINAYFKWLVEEGLLRKNPARNISAIRYQKKVKDCFTDVDVDRLKRGCSNIRDTAILYFLLSTGSRISEVCKLNIEDIDLIGKQFRVIGKGNKERVVYFDDVTSIILKEYFASRKDGKEALFLNCKGNRIQPNGVRFMLNKLAKECGVDHVHPHRCRHTMITRLLNNGMAIQEVAKIAGHAKIDTTMDYYTSNNERTKSSYMRYYN